jgi:hypothetical protein
MRKAGQNRSRFSRDRSISGRQLSTAARNDSKPAGLAAPIFARRLGFPPCVRQITSRLRAAGRMAADFSAAVYRIALTEGSAR